VCLFVCLFPYSFSFSKRKKKKKKNLTYRERKQLEGKQDIDSNEIILMNKDGNFYEGLQSNFFVVKNNQIETAPDGTVLTV
jgi:branched-subunit amino acid aminotransferase/4-amino-4-deoxychorismate lyase